MARKLRKLHVEIRAGGKLISEYDTRLTRLTEREEISQTRREIGRYLAGRICEVQGLEIGGPEYHNLYNYFRKRFDILVYDPEEVEELRKYMAEVMDDEGYEDLIVERIDSDDNN